MQSNNQRLFNFIYISTSLYVIGSHIILISEGRFCFVFSKVKFFHFIECTAVDTPTTGGISTGKKTYSYDGISDELEK